MLIKSLVLLLVTIKIHSQVTFCSAACSVNSCGTDDTNHGCLACDAPFLYNTSNALPCEQTSGNWEIITSAISIIAPNSDTVSNCGSQTFQGWFNTETIFTTSGINVPHWELYAIIWVIVADDVGLSDTFDLTLQGSTLNRDISSFDQQNDYCLNMTNNSGNQQYLKIQFNIPHTSIGTQINGKFALTSTTAVYGFKQINLVMRKCHQRCLSCYGDLFTQCTACIDSGAFQSFLANGNECVVNTSCPYQTFPNLANHLCQSCDVKCLVCSGTATNCSSCVISGPNQAFLDTDGETCLISTSCSIGSYPNPSTHVCQLCDSKCVKCSTSPTNCSQCQPSGSFQSFLDIDGQTCVVSGSCSPSSFQNIVNHVCQLCQIKCLTCTTSSTNCQSCVTSGINEAFLDLGSFSCVISTSCPSQTFPNPLNHQCDSCDAKCLVCLNSPTNCTSCVASGVNQAFLDIVGETCVINTSCPSLTFPNSLNHQCQSCDSKCLVCSLSSTNCSSCQTSGSNQAFLNGQSCVINTACPSSTFANQANHICDLCNLKCLACSTISTNCTSCPVTGVNQGFFTNNDCVNNVSCPLGQFADVSTHICTICDAKCSQCQSSATNCQACQISPPNQAFLDGTSCVLSTNCPSSTFSNSVNHICDPCDVNCLQCSVISTNCTSCKTSGANQGFLTSNTCVGNTSCPAQQFANYINHQCNPCDPKCLVCSGTLANCSSCQTSPPNEAFLDSPTFTCYTLGNCPAGKYSNSTTHTCQACNTSCSTCSFDQNNCTSCISSLYYLNNVCYSDCPINYFQVIGNPNCQPCNNLCIACDITSTNCSSCQTSPPNQSFLLNSTSQCMINCPNIDYYENTTTHTCQLCDTLCQTCNGFPIPCYTCYSPNILFEQACITDCFDGYYQLVTNGTSTCQPCNQSCTLCFGSLITQCNACQQTTPYKLSNTTCSLNCLSGYGQTDNASVCVLCFSRCAVCYQLSTNCSSCKTSGPNKGYFLAAQLKCYQTCPNGYFGNNTLVTCDPCLGNCTKCSKGPYNCTACITGLYLLNNFCYDVCPSHYYQFGTICDKCKWDCLQCDGQKWNCTSCNTTIPSFYKSDFRCYVVCPDGFFQDIPNNYTCSQCDSRCSLCDGNPTPCFGCNLGFYFYDQYCYDVCPLQTLFPDDVTQQCKLCQIFCVDLQVSMKFKTVLDQTIIVQMKFTQALDFTTFPYQTFQSFSFDNSKYSIDLFKISYVIVDGYTYQIHLQPQEFVFMYNVTITVTTMNIVDPKHKAINNRPFKDTVYSRSQNLNWFLIVAPTMGDKQKQIIAYFVNQSQLINNFTSLPGVQQIKKSGLLALIAPGIQITSATLLIHNIFPRNLYQGIRLMADFVLYNTADWQQDQSNQVYILGKSSSEIINSFKSSSSTNNRLLQLQSQWRLKRAGFTTFFVLDAYISIISIIIVWIVLIIMYCIFKKDPHCRKMGLTYTIFHKIHQVSIIYMTIAIILEWIYFDSSNGLHWISIFLSIFFVVYFLSYQLYMYYDLHQYPKTKIGTFAYSYYVTKYGSFLSSIKYEQYEVNDVCSIKLWIRPYNYHILSFYKKVLMIAALPIFHQIPLAQISVLCFIQILEIIRFCISWPYYKRIRNIVRLASQLLLLSIFSIVFALCQISIELQKNNPETIQSSIYWFHSLGWICFGLVLVFNIFWLTMAIIGIVTACCTSNRKQMDDIRKQYYFQKLDKYQDNNQDIDHSVIRDWFKKGNLNDQMQKQDFNTLNVKVQTLQLKKIDNYYQMKVQKISDLKIKPRSFIVQNEQSRINVVDKVTRHLEVTKYKFPGLFQSFQKIKQTYKISNQQTFKIKTYLTIELDDYPEGGKVIFYKNRLFQKLQIVLNGKQRKIIELKQMLQGTPLKRKLL